MSPEPNVIMYENHVLNVGSRKMHNSILWRQRSKHAHTHCRFWLLFMPHVRLCLCMCEIEWVRTSHHHIQAVEKCLRVGQSKRCRQPNAERMNRIRTPKSCARTTRMTPAHSHSQTHTHICMSFPFAPMVCSQRCSHNRGEPMKLNNV